MSDTLLTLAELRALRAVVDARAAYVRRVANELREARRLEALAREEAHAYAREQRGRR